MNLHMKVSDALSLWTFGGETPCNGDLMATTLYVGREMRKVALDFSGRFDYDLLANHQNRSTNDA